MRVGIGLALLAVMMHNNILIDNQSTHKACQYNQRDSETCTVLGSPDYDSATQAYPTRREISRVLPLELYEASLARSLPYLALSVSLTIASSMLFWLFVPCDLDHLFLWIVNAIVTGTFATGGWVIAHECGHGAFCKSRMIQDLIGFVLHSSLLVPYFTWRQSHKLHHAYNANLDLNETHVPLRNTDCKSKQILRNFYGVDPRLSTLVNLATKLLLGWPAYLLFGVSGGPSRRGSSHLKPRLFWSTNQATSSHINRKIKVQIIASFCGPTTVLGILAYLALLKGFLPVLYLYIGPYLIVNGWLVTYTWLHHTGDLMCHFEGNHWSWAKGAFMTVDRPYCALINFLHHNIGRTHVVHHLEPRIPHYHSRRATDLVVKYFHQVYVFDDQPLSSALLRAASLPLVVSNRGAYWKQLNT